MTAPDVVRLSDVVPAVAAVNGLTEREAGQQLADALEVDDPGPGNAWVASVLAPTPPHPLRPVLGRDLLDHFDTGGSYIGAVIMDGLGDNRCSVDAIWLSRRWVSRFLARAGLIDPWAAAALPPPPAQPTSVLEQQIQALLAAIREERWAPLKVPYGGKTALRGKLAPANRPGIMTSSAFDRAWKAAVADGRICVEHLERFRHPGRARA